MFKRLFGRHNQPKNEENSIAKPQAQTKPDFFAEVTQYAAQSKDEIDATITAHKEQLDRQYQEDLALKDRLSQFARSNKLDEALLALWEEIEFYPSWAKLKDWAKHNKLGVDTCEKEETIIGDDETVRLSFSLGMQRYELIKLGSFDATITLLENGEAVFGISADYETGPLCGYYKCSGITCLKNKGQWAKMLLDCWKLHQTENHRTLSELHYLDADKIKSNFEE
jgi:hypothetical protein